MARRTVRLIALACGTPLVGCFGKVTVDTPRASPPEPSVTAPVGLAERERAIDERAARVDVAAQTVPSGDPDADLATCTAWLASGRADRARPAFAALLRVHPDDPAVALAAARFRLADGDPAGAVTLLDALAARGVDHDELRVLRGTALVAAGDPERGAPLLREELATGPWFAEAALALCDHLTSVELFGDARAVVAAARRRDRERAELRLVEARLLHDTWQLDAAAAILDELLEERPELAAARVQRAEIERARARPAAGRAVLAPLDHDDPWVVEHGARVAQLEQDLASDRSALTGRDLLAMVRGARGIGTRMQALEALVGVASTRDEAIRVAFLQDEAVLRVMAIRAIPGDDPALADDLAVAIGDPDPRVRGAALRRTAEIPDVGRAVRLARTALEAEEEPYAFRAAHEALVARLGPRVTLPPDGERDPEVRERIRRAWRRECPE